MTRTISDVALLGFTAWFNTTASGDPLVQVATVIVCAVIGWSLGVRTQRYWNRKGLYE